MINNVKAIVTYFKQFVRVADQLRSAQSKDKQLKLIQSVPPKWNSISYMLERFLSLPEYVAPILIRNLNVPDMISETQMNIIKVLQILSPLEKVSKEIEKNILPQVNNSDNCLYKQLESLTPISEEVITIKNVAMFDVNKRFGALNT